EGWILEGNIFRKDRATYLPLYEAKMLHQFDHRWATYDGNGSRDLTVDEKTDPMQLPMPRFWVPADSVTIRLRDRWDRDWLLGWRDICRNTDIRTTIASILPRIGVGNKFPIFLSRIGCIPLACFVANLGAFVLDYTSRQKIGGTTLNLFILKQFAILPP